MTASWSRIVERRAQYPSQRRHQLGEDAVGGLNGFVDRVEDLRDPPLLLQRR